MYRQFMSSLCAQGQACVGTLPAVYTAGTAVYVFKCVPVLVPVPIQTFVTVPDASVKVRYDINTGAENFGKFGTTSIPVPETSVSSVQYQYRYRKLR